MITEPSWTDSTVTLNSTNPTKPSYGKTHVIYNLNFIYFLSTPKTRQHTSETQFWCRQIHAQTSMHCPFRLLWPPVASKQGLLVYSHQYPTSNPHEHPTGNSNRRPLCFTYPSLFQQAWTEYFGTNITPSLITPAAAGSQLWPFRYFHTPTTVLVLTHHLSETRPGCI